MNFFVKIHPDDNVAVAPEVVPAGTLEDGIHFDEIPAGHKAAIAVIGSGEPIIKYGFPIGVATEEIQPGRHVHSHNMKTGLSDDTKLEYHPSASTPAPAPAAIPTFMGCRRPDGRAATRNEIWIVNTVACVNVPSQRIADLASKQFLTPNCGIDGIHAFTHPYGCSQLGDDLGHTRKILSALVRHPNASAVLIVGLGCENNTMKSFLAEVGGFDPERVKFFNAQEVADEIESGLEIMKELVAYAGRFKREPIPVSELVLGMKCGGSDGFSGITANPLVGRIADRLTAMGGTVVLTEVPEMFGAEAPLFNRCDSKETFDDALCMVNEFKEYFRKHNEPIYENPSPGNKDGGITTLEEKSLGCIQKGGRAPVKNIAAYGDPAPQKLGGLCLVQAPGNDGVSATALAAAGAHCVLFTTGRGTPLGVPVPTLKIASNTSLAGRKPGWIDFNAGRLLDPGAVPEEVTDDLMQLVIDVAGGKESRNECNGFREITIWKQGVTL
ncbi:MAG: altronate dehydratase family protein [Luteolibacter sp.]